MRWVGLRGSVGVEADKSLLEFIVPTLNFIEPSLGATSTMMNETNESMASS